MATGEVGQLGPVAQKLVAVEPRIGAAFATIQPPRMAEPPVQAVAVNPKLVTHNHVLFQVSNFLVSLNKAGLRNVTHSWRRLSKPKQGSIEQIYFHQ